MDQLNIMELDYTLHHMTVKYSLSNAVVENKETVILSIPRTPKRTWYHYVQYIKPHQISLISACYHQFR